MARAQKSCNTLDRSVKKKKNKKQKRQKEIKKQKEANINLKEIKKLNKNLKTNNLLLSKISELVNIIQPILINDGKKKKRKRICG
jgi:hypothetical protein